MWLMVNLHLNIYGSIPKPCWLSLAISFCDELVVLSFYPLGNKSEEGKMVVWKWCHSVLYQQNNINLEVDFIFFTIT